MAAGAVDAGSPIGELSCDELSSSRAQPLRFKITGASPSFDLVVRAGQPVGVAALMAATHSGRGRDCIARNLGRRARLQSRRAA